jgi:hypothetical protein
MNGVTASVKSSVDASMKDATIIPITTVAATGARGAGPT